MRAVTVTLTIDVRDKEGAEYREVTTFKAEPSGLGLDEVKTRLRQLAKDLDGQEALDFPTEDQGEGS